MKKKETSESSKQLDKFIAIYRDTFGIELTRDEALAQSTALLTLMKHFLLPISKEDHQRIDPTDTATHN